MSDRTDTFIQPQLWVKKRKEKKQEDVALISDFCVLGSIINMALSLKKKPPGDVRTPLYFKQTVCSSSVQTG